MSKMGMELDKRLEENKYEMFEVCKELAGDYALSLGYCDSEDLPYFWREAARIVANIEGKDG